MTNSKAKRVAPGSPARIPMQSIADGIDFFSAAAPPVMDAVRAVQEGRVSVAFRGGRVRVTVSPEAR